MKQTYLTFLLLVSSVMSLTAQQDSITFRKTGFSFGALPVVAYDNDLGFQYGVLTNLYWYGDGSAFPRYNHSLYLEVSRYVAGTTLARAYYDSHKLIPGVRTTADFTFFNDLALDFTGFNGNESRYDKAFTEEESPEYISRIFYKHERQMMRFMFNVRKNINGRSPLYWLAGLTAFNMDIGPTQRNKLKEEVTDTPTLYENFCAWNVIRPEEQDGGFNTYLKAGFGIDTRNNEAFPTKGVWTELLFAYSPSLLSNDNHDYGKVTIYHHQYFNLHKEKLVLAYRLGLQHKLWGDTPFYLLPHWNTTLLRSATSQGLGGAKTMRGVKRNRIVGDGSFLANIEMRYVFFDFMVKGQNISVGTNLFADFGMVTQKYDFDEEKVPEMMRSLVFTDENEKLHTSAGIGLKISLNKNFTLAADWGKALDANDGESGFYVQMNYLF